MRESKYTIVNYLPEFKNQVAELQKHLWSPSVALNTAYFEWKYERNPYLDSPLIYLVLCDGKVVGMRGMFGTKWEFGCPSKTALVLCAEDMVIAPDHRKRGIMSEVMKTSFTDLGNRGYTYIFSMSAAPVTLLASLTMGWRNVGPMKPLRWIPHRTPFSRRLQRYISERPGFRKFIDMDLLHQWAEKQRPLYHLDKQRSSRGMRFSPCISVQREPQPEAMAELVRSIGNHGCIRHVRDRAYFAWRFRNPLSRYRFLFWEENGLDGYLVLQDYASEYMNRTRVNIVDWESRNPYISAELLRAAMHWCDFPVMEIWSATMDNEKKMLLSEAGFKPKDAGKGKVHQFCLLVRPVQEKTLDTEWAIADVPLLEMNSWDIRMIYSTIG